MSYLAVVSVQPDGRCAKHQRYQTKAEAAAHVERVIGKFPDAYVAAYPGGDASDWLCDPVAKTVTLNPLPLTPEPTADEIVAARIGSDPLLAAMVRRQAKIEGKTAADIQRELAEVMK